MSRRISLSVLLRVMAVLVVVFGAATSRAVAKHHHDIVSHHRGTQGGTNAIGSNTKGDSETKEPETKHGQKDDGKGNTGEVTPPEHQGNTEPETNGKGEAHGDDHAGKSAGAEENPIDTSNTIVSRPTFARKNFKLARQSKKSAIVLKSGTHRLKTVGKGPQHALVRNAIGQLVKQAKADHKGPAGKNGDPPTVNGIHGSTDPPVASSTGAAASNLHPKPVVPLAWSLSRPHDPPPAMAPYRGGLNGLTMIRVGAGTAAIGGGANLNTGVLSGSSFHPKPR